MANDYKEGTIIWAKLDEDVSWPCIIFSDDDGLFRRQHGKCSQVYVAFLLRGSRSWVDVNNTSIFRLNNRFPGENPQVVPDSLEYRLERAIDHANDILSRTAPAVTRVEGQENRYASKAPVQVDRTENSIPAELKRPASSTPIPLKGAALNITGRSKRPPCYIPQESQIPVKLNRVADNCSISPQPTSHGQVKKGPCYMPNGSRIPARVNGSASNISEQLSRGEGEASIAVQTSASSKPYPRRVPCYASVNRQHTLANVHARDNGTVNNSPSQVNMSASDDKVNTSPEDMNAIFHKVRNGEVSLLGALKDLQLSRSTANRYYAKFTKDLEERCDTNVSDEGVNCHHPASPGPRHALRQTSSSITSGPSHQDSSPESSLESRVHRRHDETSDTHADSFLPALKFNVNDKTQSNHFLCNTNCVNELVANIAEHSKVCTGSVVFFKEFSLPKSHKGFTNFICLYKCFTCERTIEFSSSPLLDERPISDYIVLHSKMTSGGEWENVERFTETIGFSSDFTGKFLTEDFQMNKYCEIISELAEESMQEARSQVIIEGDLIDTSTDASHENRTNSGNSCVTMISPDTFQVVFRATVSREEEPVSQCHEKLGTEKICQQVKKVNLKIRANSTDHGSASRQVISKEFPPPLGIEQLDLYHGLKSSRKEIKKCTDGKDEDHGITWHEELSEKCGPLVEHLRYAVKESSITVDEYRDPVLLEAAKIKLQARILLPVQHYQDKHERCSPSSRCNQDPLYELSRRKVTDPVALKLMEKSLTSTVFYKNPERFLLNISTSMNESFHNRQIKYLSKKVHLTPKMYRMCIDLAVCDHNENETNIFHNGKRIEALPLNSDNLPKKPLATRTFVRNIWYEYISARINNFI